MSSSEPTSVSEVNKNKAPAASSIKATGGETEIEIGSGEGSADSTVTIPVKAKTVPEKGIGSFNFSIKYDKDTLEVVEVKQGDVFEGKSDFDYTIIDSTGTISFLFTSSNSGNDFIKKPGTVTNLSFKVKKDAKKGVTKITSGTSNTFGDISLNRINAKFKEGEIKVN